MHVRSLLVVLVTGMVALVAGGAGCSMLTNSDSNEGRQVASLVAEVDSIDTPNEIASSDTLTVQFYGTVGPNGCYSFERFDVERSASRLIVTPVVERVTGEDVVCTMAIVPLDVTYTAAPPFEEGTLTVEVPQTDGSEVTATVEVVKEK